MQVVVLLSKPVVTDALEFYQWRERGPAWDGGAVISGPPPIRVLAFGGGCLVLALCSTASPEVSVLLLGVPLVHGSHLVPVGQVMGDRTNARTEAVAVSFDRTAYLPMAPIAVLTLDTPLFSAAYRAASTREIAWSPTAILELSLCSRPQFLIRLADAVLSLFVSR